MAVIRNLIIAGLIAIAGVATAQTDAAFYVLATKGGVFADGKPLTRSSVVSEKSTVQTYGNGYACLVYRYGRVLELEGKMQVKIDSVVQAWETQFNFDKTVNYIDQILIKEPFPGEMLAFKETKRNVQNVFLHVPDFGHKTDVYSRDLLVKWCLTCEGFAEKKTFHVSYESLFSEKVYETDVAVNHHILDLDSLGYRNDQLMVKVNAAITTDRVTENLIIFLNGERKKKIDKELGDLKLDNTAGSEITKAFYFESNQLYYDVVKAYHDAIKKRPDVEDFKTLYRDYLIRNHIVDL